MPMLLVAATIMYLDALAAAAAKVLHPGLEETDKLMPYMLMNHVPIIISTILCAGLRQLRSTANSQIHSLAALYTVDVHKRYMGKEIQERQLVSISKYAIVILAAFAYVLMLRNPGMIIDRDIRMGGRLRL